MTDTNDLDVALTAASYSDGRPDPHLEMIFAAKLAQSVEAAWLTWRDTGTLDHDLPASVKCRHAFNAGVAAEHKRLREGLDEIIAEHGGCDTDCGWVDEVADLLDGTAGARASPPLIVAGKCGACWSQNDGEGCDWAVCECGCHEDDDGTAGEPGGESAPACPNCGGPTSPDGMGYGLRQCQRCGYYIHDLTAGEPGGDTT